MIQIIIQKRPVSVKQTADVLFSVLPKGQQRENEVCYEQLSRII